MAESNAVDFPYFDKMRHLRFTFQDFIDLETRSGKSPSEFIQNILRLSAIDMRIALMIGLRHEDRHVVTLDWVSQQVQKFLIERKGTTTQILRALDQAFVASRYFAAEETEETDGPNPQTASSASTGRSATHE